MGQKISPILLRTYPNMANVDNNSTIPSSLQKSVWFAGNGVTYSKIVIQDRKIREYLKKKLAGCAIVQVIIRRYVKKVEITIFTAKPGLVIGKAGAAIGVLKDELVKKFGLLENLRIEVLEFPNLYKSASAVAEEVATAIQKGLAYRRIIKGTIEKIKYAGVVGAKIYISGRINGAEIARSEVISFGSTPRQTISANIDYCQYHCQTKTGILGIKVYLNLGDKFKSFN